MSVSTPVQGSPSPAGQRLYWRRLDPRTDAALLRGVEIGTSPSEQEVEYRIRETAVEHDKKGNCSTSLFFLPGDDRVVGFLSAGINKLAMNRELRDLFKISSRNLPISFDAAFIVAMGVDARFRGNHEHYGSEIHSLFIDSLKNGMLRPRFVYLEVWEDNPAVETYKWWRYKELPPAEKPLLRGHEKIRRLQMALDRFQEPDR